MVKKISKSASIESVKRNKSMVSFITEGLKKNKVFTLNKNVKVFLFFFVYCLYQKHSNKTK